MLFETWMLANNCLKVYTVTDFLIGSISCELGEINSIIKKLHIEETQKYY